MIFMAKKVDIEELKSKLRYGVKIWLEFQGEEKNENILGSGWARLLDIISKTDHCSLTYAAQECKYSYKYAWNILKRIEERTGLSPVITSKGGKGGGGSIKLSEWGLHLLNTYNKISAKLENTKKELHTFSILNDK